MKCRTGKSKGERNREKRTSSEYKFRPKMETNAELGRTRLKSMLGLGSEINHKIFDRKS